MRTNSKKTSANRSAFLQRPRSATLEERKIRAEKMWFRRGEGKMGRPKTEKLLSRRTKPLLAANPHKNKKQRSKGKKIIKRESTPGSTGETQTHHPPHATKKKKKKEEENVSEGVGAPAVHKVPKV